MFSGKEIYYFIERKKCIRIRKSIKDQSLKEEQWLKIQG
jgi:hypothetical protein